ncbi:MAG: hypothetical protein ABUL73_01730, partial [Alphaproteobacteria bacterium]
MQSFVNQELVDRIGAEIFASARSRYYLFGVLALGLASASSLALAAIWLGLLLLVDETRKALGERLGQPKMEAPLGALALDIAGAAAVGAAPALAWFSRGPLSAPLAMAMLAMLAVNIALTPRRTTSETALAATPLAGIAFTILVDGASSGAYVAALASVLTAAFAFAATLRYASRARAGQEHADAEDDIFLAQINAALDGSASAVWEIDLITGMLHGSESLSALLGRDVSYDDVMDRGCFASPEDRALVRAAFRPNAGAMTRFAIEHTVLSPQGGRFLVRHQ